MGHESWDSLLLEAWDCIFVEPIGGYLRIYLVDGMDWAWLMTIRQMRKSN